MSWLANVKTKLIETARKMDKKQFMIVLFLAFLAFVLRKVAANNVPLDFDEYSTYLPAAKKYAEFIRHGSLASIINYRYNFEHPVFIKLLYGAAFVLTDTFVRHLHALMHYAFVARMVSIAFSVAHIILISIVNPIAGFFVATSSWHIKYSSQAMLDGISTFFATAALFSFMKAKGNWNKYMIISAVTMGLAFGSKYVTATTALTIAPFLLWQTRKNIKYFFYYTVIAVGTFFIVDPAIWVHTFSRFRESVFFHQAYRHGQLVTDAAMPFYQQFSWLTSSVPWENQANYYFFKLDNWLLILGLCGVPYLFKRSRILGTWFMINFIFLLLWTTKWPQYTLMIIPALALSAGELLRGVFGKQPIELSSIAYWHLPFKVKKINFNLHPMLKKLLVYVTLVLGLVITLFPIFLVVIASIRRENILLNTSLDLLPKWDSITLDAYKGVFEHTDFKLWLKNSLIITGIVTLANVIIGALAAFSFSRFKFKGKQSGLLFVLALQIFPSLSLIIPIYLILWRLGLASTHIGLILAYSVSALPFCIWNIKRYFDSIPQEVDEAAMIDGAGLATILFRIIIPLSLPSICATAFLTFIVAWNEYLMAVTYLMNESLYTLPVGLMSFLNGMTIPWNEFAAASILTSLPVVAGFIILQKYLLASWSFGKGE